MPAGFQSTAANRQPVYVDDDTRLGVVNNKRQVITGAMTLGANQSGALCVMNSLTGTLFTLPAPVVGLIFEFFVSLANTSGSHKVITDAAETFIIGDITQNTVGATPAANDGPKTFAFNGTTHVAIAMNGTTTGGVIGTRFRLECINATQWAISGHVVASGIIATPAATS